MRKRDQIAWESRWALPAAIATFAAVALLIGSNMASEVSGTGDAEVLRSVHAHSSSVALTGALQSLAFLLLAVPLFYLFKVVRGRSDRVRQQLVGLVVIAPIFLCLSSALTIGARGEAADKFVAGEAKLTLTAAEAKEKCSSERKDEGAKAFAEEFEPAAGESAQAACEKRKLADNEASNAIGESSLAPLVSGLGLAGGLGLAISLFYSCLWAMRTGVLTRFWASLGMVSGVAFLLGPLFIISLLWFVYFGLLLIDRVPGGRPPAWAAGEAIPWPTPGEKAAAELAGPDDAPSDAGEQSPTNGDLPGGDAPRKRKQRD
ncbi:MAG: hypothetical protein ABW065_07775 [Solirubrobacterales bacterium]